MVSDLSHHHPSRGYDTQICLSNETLNYHFELSVRPINTIDDRQADLFCEQDVPFNLHSRHHSIALMCSGQTLMDLTWLRLCHVLH